MIRITLGIVSEFLYFNKLQNLVSIQNHVFVVRVRDCDLGFGRFLKAKFENNAAELNFKLFSSH